MPAKPNERATKQEGIGDGGNFQQFLLINQRWLLPMALLLGAFFYLVWAWSSGQFIPIVADDISQLRSNTVLPSLRDDLQARQTFRPMHDGLREVELLVARSAEVSGSGRLEVQLLDSTGRVIASKAFRSNEIAHNQTLNLRFPPQAESANQVYTLVIGGSTNNNASIWAYDLDVHDGGELNLVGGQTTAQDLRFVTRYQLSLKQALQSISFLLSTNFGLLTLSLCLMLLPGFILLLATDRWLPVLDPGAWLGLAMAIGLAMWPLLWLWLTQIGGRWRPWSLWLVFISGWLLVLGLLVYRVLQRRSVVGQDHASPNRSTLMRRRSTRLTWHHLVLLLIFLVALAVRLLAVRDLAFPPWVDSIRHALITTVMSESGQAMPDYEPYLPVDRFPYHFGFHSLATGVNQMIDPPLPNLLIVLGQLINALLPVALFASVYMMVRKRGTALIAAFLLAVPFFFPAYYATWGRMTQLAAMLVLAITLAITWQLIRGGTGWRRTWWLIALLVSGLFLIHFRVFLFYLFFAGLIWLISRGRNGRWLAMAGILTIALVAPHAIRLYQEAATTIGARSIPGYNDFPFGYVAIGWERDFLLLTGVAVLLSALAAIRGKLWAWLPLSLAGWMGLTAILLSGQNLGLPEIRLLNLNSAYISAFLPVAIILAVVTGRIWRWLGQWTYLKVSAAFVAGALLVAALIFGIGQQITILNPVTILARAEDRDGIGWLEENLDENALIAVNSWQWLGQTWAGADGGAWILPLTGLATTTPPADYIYNRELARNVRDFNVQLQTINDWSDPAAVDWLKEQGVTHVYVGAIGGTVDPAYLAKNPALQIEYARNGVFVFAVQDNKQ